MATEKRLIDVNKAIAYMNQIDTESPFDDKEDILEKCVNILHIVPTVDAVEVSRLGKLGQLMIPYTGCPRGMIGERGEDGTDSCHLTELDAITDVDGNRWIPVFENDLSQLKAKADAVEVVHGRWTEYGIGRGRSFCSECGYNGERSMNYCPNCGAKMDLKGE